MAEFYERYIKLFDKDCLPKIIQNKNGQVLDFTFVIAKSFDKFNQNKDLNELLKLF